jgi:hypothetical protein
VEEQRLAAAEKFLRVPPWWSGNIWAFIEVELGQTELRGAHKLRGRALPPGRALWACGPLLSLLASSRSFQGPFWSRKN